MPDITISNLFSGLSIEETTFLLSEFALRNSFYCDGEMIAFEGDPCSSIGIILEGEVIIQRLLSSGKRMILENLHAGDCFGEVVVFSNHATYPASVESAAYTRILFLSKEQVIQLCSRSAVFLHNFIGSLTEKILLLNQKIQNLSLQSPRQKTIQYILGHYKKQKNLKLNIYESRQEMADKLNLPRPSLSREFMKLKTEGLIDYGKDFILINSIQKLEYFINK